MPRTLGFRIKFLAFLLATVVFAFAATTALQVSSSAAAAGTGGVKTSERGLEVLRAGAACGLGVRWDETEGDWSAVWTRRNNSNVFDAVATNSSGQQATYILTISISGNTVNIARREDSYGNDCDYTGTIDSDGVTVHGTYQCSRFTAFPSWQATIRCNSGLCASAPSGLVGWWPGEGGAGDVVNNNDGALQNGVTFAAGKVGQAFSFNGNSQYVTVPHSDTLNQSQEVAVEAWVRPAEFPQGEWMSVVSKDNPASGPYHLVVHRDGSVGWQVLASSSWTEVNSGSNRISPGVFSHIAGTYNASTGAFCVYVNGAATCNQLSGPMRTNTNAIKIGGDLYNGLFFKGEIDEVGIFNRALSASEIQSIYSAGSAGKCGVRPQTPRNPLIFIPGIMGSRLDLNETNSHSNLWPGPADYFLLSPDARPRRNIIATDVIRKSISPFVRDPYGTFLDRLKGGGYVEYDDGDDPAKRRTDGCQKEQRNESGDKPDLFVFPYDWRKSNADNVADLDQYVQCVQLIHPGSKVDILTHSMGGLLARNYIIQKDSPPVDKLITVSAPWLGATNALHMMESGKTAWGVEVPILKSVFSKLAQSLPAVHELLPSSSYFDLGGRPLLVNGGTVEKYSDYKKLINDAYPGDPATNGALFHDGYQGQDDGTVNLKGVKYYHLYGIQNGRQTIASLDVLHGTVFCAFGKCVTYTYVVPRMGVGDGTVPELSLSRNNGQKNLNASGATVFPAFRSSDKNKVEHTGLLKNDAVFSALTGALQGTLNVSTSPSVMAEAAAEQMYYLRYNGPTNLTITDAGGLSSKPLSDPPDADLPTVTSYPLGSNSAIAVIPLDQIYVVTFRGDGQPMSLEVTREDDSPLQAVRYTDLGIPSGVLAQMKLTPQGVEELRYDQDGDGTFETVVAPSAAVTGSAAQDTTAPVVTIAGATEGAGMRVSISASDAGSGVKGISFSLDGNSYQSYAGPFVVNLAAGPVVYAFADDQAANRSAVVTFYPTATANQIDNARFFVRQHYLDFLYREADQSGGDFWTTEITKCGADVECREVKRINVSAAFFLSIEFQQTGYLAYRGHKAAFGNIQGKPVPITRGAILQDVQLLGSGLVVGAEGWEQKLEQNKQTYFEQLAASDRFTALYPQSMTSEAYVDALNVNAGGILSQSERNALVAELKSGAKSRAQAVRAVAEDADLTKAEFNKAFVLMQYFGYLRRDPDSAPDSDFSGFNFWLGKLNQFNGNFIQAEMVKAFLDSIEYRNRFTQ